ncbi:MAG: kelch motif-containing protein, partial [Acidobacteriaceae bacterium]|nr:kelch motif-containing protein [Acidobacteriaceae bacterium]
MSAVILALLLGSASLASAQNPYPSWVPMGGTTPLPASVGTFKGILGVYGAMGAADSANAPGGRYGQATWTVNGQFWMFGGYGSDANGCSGTLNDLWMYDPATGLWTWVNGQSTYGTPNPVSGNCGGVASVYGAQGAPDPTSMPGSRYTALTWTDASGNLWMYGGTLSGSDGGPLFSNELWMYSIADNRWAWMGGDNVTSPSAIYSAAGAPAPAASSWPGARNDAVTWVDASGMLWLFSGVPATVTNANPSNDVWSYDPSAQQWTWYGPAAGADPGGDGNGWYVTAGAANAANLPGSRSGARSWTDASGNLWIFGGYGWDAAAAAYPAPYNTPAQSWLNDLWKYDASGQWTLMATNTYPWQGSSPVWDWDCSEQSYGTQGVTLGSNMPGARADAVTWVDASGNLWMFGGYGMDSTCSPGSLNDLWMYDTASNKWTWQSGSKTANPSALATTPSGRSSASGWTDASNNLWVFGGNDGAHFLNDLWEYTSGVAPTDYQQLAITTAPAALPVALPYGSTFTVTVDSQDVNNAYASTGLPITLAVDPASTGVCTLSSETGPAPFTATVTITSGTGACTIVA